MITTKEKTEIMQAHENGKDIEFRNKNAEIWKPIIEPEWDWVHNIYRIKPEPQYVPYDNVTEINKDGWIKGKHSKQLYRIVGIDPYDNTVLAGINWWSLTELFEDCTYEDGTPCGKLEVTT